ncbi:MAG: serpin family protein [Deltaproteobacteria bacterium]|nr:serpin family protein [Deltaproteobacteria bacterium]
MHRSILVLSILTATGCATADPRAITDVTPAMMPLVRGSNAFAWGSYAALDAMGTSGNLFYSPFSIVAAFSMVYGGAEGNTASQLEDAFGIEDESAWHRNMGLLLEDLTGEHHRPYTLHTANRIWAQAGFPFETPFLDLTAETYGASLAEADFVAEAEAVREEINAWVADQTRDRIPELLPEGSVSGDTIMVLANAIYFLADWATQFDADDTWDQSFTRAAGGTVQVPFMHAVTEFGYAEDASVQILEMPYETGDLSMYVILPQDGVDLEGIADLLTVEQVDAWIADLSVCEVDVAFPSFQMDWTLPLVDTLLEMGVTDAFDPGLADFTDIADPVEGNIFIQTAVHKAFVRVDEKGTEAAAATGIVMDLESAEPERPIFEADHPFVYFIRDNLTTSILFLGRMEDPSEAPLED